MINQVQIPHFVRSASLGELFECRRWEWGLQGQSTCVYILPGLILKSCGILGQLLSFFIYKMETVIMILTSDSHEN